MNTSFSNTSPTSYRRGETNRKSCPHPHLKCCLRCGICDCAFNNYQEGEYEEEENEEVEENLEVYKRYNDEYRNALRILANKYEQTSMTTTTHLYGAKLHPRYTSSIASSSFSSSSLSSREKMTGFSSLNQNNWVSC